MNLTERTVVFPCAGEALVGVITVPARPRATGVLIVVGGPQYRSGSHRQFLLLSRALAAAGFAVMRFDYRGMGDSTGDLRDFLSVNEDISAALAVFCKQCPEIANVVLWGLCDAASASLLYWASSRDERVAGLVLLNPWVRSETTLAKTQIKHYYGQRLLQAEFWRKLLSGRVGVGTAIAGVFNSLRLASKKTAPKSAESRSYVETMADAWRTFPGEILLVLSGNDYTAKEFVEATRNSVAWQRALGRPFQRHDLAAADHTFSSHAWRKQVEDWTIAWIGKLDDARSRTQASCA